MIDLSDPASGAVLRFIDAQSKFFGASEYFARPESEALIEYDAIPTFIAVQRSYHNPFQFLLSIQETSCRTVANLPRWRASAP
jgi:hypothetical protein